MYKIEAVLHHTTSEINIFIFQEHYFGNIVSVAKPVVLEFDKINTDPMQPLSIKPTFIISRHDMMNNFGEELVKALSKIGVRSPLDSKSEGILEATKFHLEDMRKLVFKNK